MSCVIVLTPIIVAAWPTVAASITVAAGLSGFRLLEAKRPEAISRGAVELELQNSALMAESLGPNNQITIARDGVTVAFSTDPNGRLKTCVSGSLAEVELERIGEELAGRVVQHYVHQRLTAELDAMGFVIVDQVEDGDSTIKLHVRRYEG